VERRFTLEYWSDEGWYVGRLKEVPGVFSQGRSLVELETNVRDAYRLLMGAEERSVGVPPVHEVEITVTP
jgi:predicted RNase H-like HicB family nuclease